MNPTIDPGLLTPQGQLREQRCGNCKFCQDLNQHIGQCHKYAPTAQVVANPDYVKGLSEEEIKAMQKAKKQIQGPVIALFPYPWPQMALNVDWCGAWQMRPVVKLAKNIPPTLVN